MEKEVTLRIVLEKPTAGVEFGIQQGRGSDYQTIQKQRSKGKDLRFEFEVRVRPGGNAVAPNFLGPFVQGPSDGRFIYIDIGTYAGQTETSWSRRLKIPLTGISWDTIDRVAAEPGSVLKTRVPGAGKDGGPSCGTAKPFEGWKLARSRGR